MLIIVILTIVMLIIVTLTTMVLTIVMMISLVVVILVSIEDASVLVSFYGALEKLTNTSATF